MSDELQKAFKWMMGCDTGMSSKAICSHMVSGVSDGSYPYDPADLGRCLRLLELFPQWIPRMAEMTKYGPVWKVYVENWDKMHSMMADEVGIDWSKGRKASKTYDFMRVLQDDVRRSRKEQAA